MPFWRFPFRKLPWCGHSGKNVLVYHLHHGAGFNIDGLAVVLQHDLVAGVHLHLGVNPVTGEQINVFLINKVGECIGGRPQIQKPSFLRRFLDPRIVVAVSVEDDPLVGTDGVTD